MNDWMNGLIIWTNPTITIRNAISCLILRRYEEYIVGQSGGHGQLYIAHGVEVHVFAVVRLCGDEKMRHK